MASPCRRFNSYDSAMDPESVQPSKLPPGIIEVAPQHALASPCQVSAQPDVGAPFWLPGWRDILRHMGWRWVLLLPAAGLIAIAVAGVLDPRRWALFWYIGFKPLIIIVAIPAVLVMHLARTAIKLRREPFCIHCGYDLSGLQDNHACPECGRPYTFAVVEEYRRDPHWFIQRWKAQHQIPAADAPFIAGSGKRRKSRDGT